MDLLDLLVVQESRDSQESCPTPQFKTFNSSLLTILYAPTVTSIHDNWKNSFDYTELIQQSNVFAFKNVARLVITFLQTSKHLLISWLQSSSAVILEPLKINSHCFHCFPIYLPWSDGTKCHDLHFLNVEFKPDVSLSPFTFIKRLFSFFSHSAMRVVFSAYLRLLIFLPATVIPACASSSWAFHMRYSAYNLNKQGGNIQPLHTPFLIWNQSAVPCSVLTVASWPAYRFLRRQIRWSGIPVSVSIPQFVVIHTVKGFCMVNKAEVGIFLEFSCFFLWSNEWWQYDIWFLCFFSIQLAHMESRLLGEISITSDMQKRPLSWQNVKRN